LSNGEYAEREEEADALKIRDPYPNTMKGGAISEFIRGISMSGNEEDERFFGLITSPKNEDSFLYAPASALIAFALTRVLSKL